MRAPEYGTRNTRFDIAGKWIANPVVTIRITSMIPVEPGETDADPVTEAV